MTKAEQTLNNYVNKVDDTDDYILSAMEEQSIKFAEWLSNNYVNMGMQGKTPIWWQLNCGESSNEFTTEQLYKLFNEL